MRAFAVAAPGLEGVVADELRELGMAHVAEIAGGAEFDATAESIARANLWLRTATRVLLRIGEVEARDFAKLRKRAADLPWERYLDERSHIEPTVTVRRSRLYHSDAVAERIALAASDKLGGSGEAVVRVVVRGENDVFSVSVDTSGELLHRRGWRTEAGEAPLRETLAAALLRLAHWARDDEPFWDPTCGSGTLVLEAAALATRRAPGLGRSFAFERFPGHVAAVLEGLRAEARAAVRPAPAPLEGSDVDPAVIEVARRNAERAGMAAEVTFNVAAAEEAARSKRPRGLVLANPPYGKRLRGGPGLYRALGVAARVGGHRLALLSADPNLLRAAGRTQAVISLMNGGTRVWLALYVPPK